MLLCRGAQAHFTEGEGGEVYLYRHAVSAESASKAALLGGFHQHSVLFLPIGVRTSQSTMRICRALHAQERGGSL